MNKSLEDHIRSAIWNYPLLYRSRNNPKLSRLEVLGHMFFVIGNGYEWDKDTGTLFIEEYKSPKKLPNDYFSKELVTVDLSNEQIEILIPKIENRFYYILHKSWCEQNTIIFESSQEEAQELTGLDFVMSAESGNNISPYGLCKYSAMVELLEGKTNSSHIENYNFDDYPVGVDWIQGCRDYVVEALSYYKDEKRYKTHHYHSSNSYDYYYYEAKRAGKRQLTKYRKDHGFKKGETLRQKLKRSWKSYKRKQLKYIREFLKKYPE